MTIYRFTDTIERALRSGYPAEALNFNGIYFEDEIEGYQTLSVSGREALEAEVAYIETKARHGAKYRSRRYLPRVITVRYKIRAKDSSDLIEKYNRLNYLLGVEEARLIFQDEPDKFWIGTRRSLAPPEEGLLMTTGEIEFYCADPFKYSVEKHEVRAEGGAITTHYRGTVPNPPVFRIRAKADTGRVEFLKDSALVGIGGSYDITKISSGLAKTIFTFDEMSAGYAVTGRLAPCIQEKVAIFYQTGYDQFSPPVPEWIEPGTQHVERQTETIDGAEWTVPLRHPYNEAVIIYPDGVSNEMLLFWMDPSAAIALIPEAEQFPTDLSALDNAEYFSSKYQIRGTGLGYSLQDKIEHRNFTLSFESRIYSDNPAGRGAQSFAVYAEGTRTVVNDNDESSEVTYHYPVFGIGISKKTIGTNRLEIDVYVDGNPVDTIIMSSLESNEVFGKKSLPCSLSRYGKTCTLRLGNETYTYNSSEAAMPSYAGIYACDYVGARMMTCNAVRYVRYEEQTAKTANEIMNIIRAGDEIVIDCASADIRVNGISEPGLGDIANQWDAMDLEPGDNNIAVISVADEPPQVVMEYREAYI